MVLNLFISTIIFMFFIAMGYVLMFVDSLAFGCGIIFFIYLCCLWKAYQENNCVGLERKDYSYSGIVVACFALYYSVFDYQITIELISFLYLSAFVATVAFASSIRFKSLM